MRRRRCGAAIGGSDVLLARRRRIGSRELDIAGPSLVVVLGRNPIAVRSPRRAGNAGSRCGPSRTPGAMAVADHALALLLAGGPAPRRGRPGECAPGPTANGASRRGRPRSAPSPSTGWAGGRRRAPRRAPLGPRRLRRHRPGGGPAGPPVSGCGFSYFQRRPLFRGLEPPLRGRLPPPPLEELLESSDAVSLHAPHTEETENLLDAAALDRMKPGAILGETPPAAAWVDEAALAERLREGKLGGAGLDVFREEPLPADHPFADTPRLVLAPHTGGAGAGGAAGTLRPRNARDPGTFSQTTRETPRGHSVMTEPNQEPRTGKLHHGELRVGPVACPPGGRAAGLVPAIERVDGAPLGFPVLIANGSRPGPVLLSRRRDPRRRAGGGRSPSPSSRG